MNRLLLTLAFLSSISATAQRSGTGLPRVVVNILVDQLRADYLEAFMPLYGDGGLKRLLAEGCVYQNAEYPNEQPDRASAAATFATGAAPAEHGIIARQWYDRETLRPTSCIHDDAVSGIGTNDRFSAAGLSVSTLSDELKVATEGKALVYSIAAEPDVAVLMGGHAADAAIWIDDFTGAWCSSTYYFPALPFWVQALATMQEEESPSQKQLLWEPSSELVGEFSYFLSGGRKEPFSHKIKGDERVRMWKTSGLVNAYLASAAESLLRHTNVGADAITDYLALTLYAGNFEHQSVADAPMEQQDIYVRLDAAIEQIIRAVEEKAGKGCALFVLTSTGYTEEDGSDLTKYRVPTGTFDADRAASLLNMYLVAIYGAGSYVESVYGTQFYLNHELLQTKQINESELLARCQNFLLQLAGVRDVYTSERLLQGAWTPGIAGKRAGFCPGKSGDILLEISAGWRITGKTSRSPRLSREAYIAFPVIFCGTGIQPQQPTETVTVDRIAPTLCKALRIRAPNACRAKPLF